MGLSLLYFATGCTRIVNPLEQFSECNIYIRFELEGFVVVSFGGLSWFLILRWVIPVVWNNNKVIIF